MFLDGAQAFGPNVQTRTKKNIAQNSKRNICLFFFFASVVHSLTSAFQNMCHKHPGNSRTECFLPSHGVCLL